MIGSARFTAAFASGADATDPTTFRGVVRAAARSGFAIIFLETGTKIPICPLSSVARKRADDLAKEAARETGDQRWAKREHACGKDHASSDPKFLDDYLKRRLGNGGTIPNVAIEVGASRMLCVDVDTPSELAGWAATWLKATGRPWPVDGLTVTSPGVEEQGTWKHHGGGHIWIDLSGLEPSEERDLLLGTGDGVFKHPSGWTALYRDRYVLVPPSRRKEGPYSYVGQPLAENVDWLLAEIATAAVEREARRMESAERRAARLADPALGLGDRGLIEWSTGTPWSELLSSQGWVDTGLSHSCGCPDWTMAPVEDHGSPRSATAHEEGCGAVHYTDEEGHSALHLWSDTRPPWLLGLGPTMTKVQFVAAVARPESRHGQPLGGDDIAAGLRSQGLGTDGVKLVGLLVPAVDGVPAPPVPDHTIAAALAAPPVPPPPVVPPPPAPGPLPPAPVLGTLGIPAVGPERHPHVIVPEPREISVAPDSNLSEFLVRADAITARPKPEPLIPGVLDVGKLARFIGPSGHGKTFVVTDIALSIAAGIGWADFECAGRATVLYVAPEDPEGVAARMVAWCRAKGFDAEQTSDILGHAPIFEYTELQAGTQGWERLVEIVRALRPAFVVVDTQAQVSSQEYKENDNGEMQRFVAQVSKLRNVSGATVALVHHTPKNGDTGRGAGSVTGSMDFEYLITSDKGPGISSPTITILNTKAKSRPEWAETRDAFLVPVGDSAVLTFDPTRRPTPPKPSTEQVTQIGAMEQARSRAVLKQIAGPLAGMTRGQAIGVLTEDGAGGQRGGERTWRRAIDGLMDAGLISDAHGTVYGRQPGEQVEKVYAAPMAMFAVQAERPEQESVAPQQGSTTEVSDVDGSEAGRHAVPVTADPPEV